MVLSEINNPSCMKKGNRKYFLYVVTYGKIKSR